jgi:NTP pyrophosphatase (non-canonical NTP hydrolase)
MVPGTAWYQHGDIMQEKYRPKTLPQKLGYLVEEMGEVQAAVGKSIRWGLDSYNPELPQDERELNGDWILRELKDLEGAIALVREAVGIELQAVDGDPR